MLTLQYKENCTDICIHRQGRLVSKKVLSICFILKQCPLCCNIAVRKDSIWCETEFIFKASHCLSVRNMTTRAIANSERNFWLKGAHKNRKWIRASYVPSGQKNQGAWHMWDMSQKKTSIKTTVLWDEHQYIPTVWCRLYVELFTKSHRVHVCVCGNAQQETSWMEQSATPGQRQRYSQWVIGRPAGCWGQKGNVDETWCSVL